MVEKERKRSSGTAVSAVRAVDLREAERRRHEMAVAERARRGRPRAVPGRLRGRLRRRGLCCRAPEGPGGGEGRSPAQRVYPRCGNQPVRLS